MAGGRWALVGSAHGRALMPISGALRLGQRFAIDFAARLDASCRTRAPGECVRRPTSWDSSIG